MKISKQERILIVVFLVAAIVGVGIFVFILPNFNKIGDNNKQLASVKQQYQEILRTLPTIFSTTSQNTRLTRLCVSSSQRARI